MRRRFLHELKMGLALIFGLAGYLAITVGPPFIVGELLFDTTPDWWAVPIVLWVLVWIAVGVAFGITAMDQISDEEKRS